MHEVVEARTEDAAALGRSLARAFEDDPVFAWMIPPTAGNRMDKLTSFFRSSVAIYLRRQKTALTVPGREGAALWAPPGGWKTNPLDLLRSGSDAVRTFGARLPRALQALTMIEKRHPAEPHWYLGALGTVPEAQGKGIGAALVQPVLDRCDREGLGAYLESSKERNVPYYRRFGFEVTEELQLPKGGPTVWLMWRYPQPDAIA